MPKALDLVEQHFGYLEVLEKAGHNSQGKVTWKCLCHNCGKIVEVPTRGLTSGEYKSCGCMKGNRRTKDDLAGQKINNLTVIEYVGKSKWKCKCDCGNETIKKAQDLKSGRAKTCSKCVSQVEDLKGKIFGVQKVISLDKVEDGRAYWKCICTKCGKESIRTGQSLRNGKGISCRCCVDKTDNLVGQTFGRLTVIERVENNKNGQAMWKCVCNCDCGNEVIVSGKNLKNGNTKSCGCLKKEHRYNDISGKRYGYLEVLSLAYTKNNKTYWNCLCHNCGKEKIVHGGDMQQGKIISCGCLTPSHNGSQVENEIKEFVKGLLEMKRADITGQKFGRLTVLKYAGDNKWECKCDCDSGNVVVVSAQKLKSGHTKSCGCLRKEKVREMTKSIEHKKQYIDITGQKYGRLLVIEYAYTKDKRAYWRCKCDCGCDKEVIVSAKALRNGSTKSCGCLRKDYLENNTREKRNVEEYPQWFVEELANEEDKQRALNKTLTTLDVVEFNCSTHGVYKQKVGDHISKGEHKCGCPQCGMETRYTTSEVESEIGDYVNNLGQETTKDRTILDGKEIDIYIPELKLGIEYNGSPFHASVNAAFSNNKPMGYHRDKFLLAKEKGIHLISIFDVDWTNNEEKIKNYIKYLIEPKRRIYARKCELVKLPDDIACAFVDKWHLQGSNKATMKINYGLYYTEGKFKNLVAVMSFGIPRLKKQEGKEYELHRYCVAENYIILGGAERLLHQFEVEYTPDKIISYSDNDYFIGGIYEKLGFENRGQCKPRYYWFKNGQEIRRERCQLKHLKVEYPELLQEAYNVDASNKEDYVMVALGACKVYRSGNTKWEKICKGSEYDG